MKIKAPGKIAEALRIGEAAAQKRVVRALEKLRACFAKRGVTLTATVIAGALAANAVVAAPAGLALAIKAASLAGASTGTLTIIKFMSMTQIKFSVAALLVAGAATAFVVQHQAHSKLRQENDALRQQVAQLQTENLSHQVATASVTPANSEHLELLKLRGDVAVLQRQNGELSQLHGENQQLAATIKRSEPVAETPEEQRAMGYIQMNRAKSGMLALLMFAQDNQQQYPHQFVTGGPLSEGQLR